MDSLEKPSTLPENQQFAPENRPFAPRGNESSSKHQFAGGLALSFKEGNSTHLIQQVHSLKTTTTLENPPFSIGNTLPQTNIAMEHPPF